MNPTVPTRACDDCGKTIVARYRRCRSCRRSAPKPPTQHPGTWDAETFLALWLASTQSSRKALARRLGFAPWQLRSWLTGRVVARRATQERLREALGATT